MTRKLCTIALGYALLAPAAAQAATYTVNRATDEALGMGGVTCAAGAPCTLRAAIARANINPGADTIQFSFGGAAATIAPATELPEIIGPVTIDGYANGAGTPNTAATGHNAAITIRLDGANQPSGDGLRFGLGASDSRLTGLAVTRFTGVGVVVDGYGQASGADRIAIMGNFIGTDGSGTGGDESGALANGKEGITVHATLTRVGGSLPAERNLIVSNLTGVRGNRDLDTLIANNYIGTDRTGNVARGNATLGVFVNAENTIVRDNVIGTNRTGIVIGGESNDVAVFRNRIGVGTGGAAITGPGSLHGVWISDTASMSGPKSPARVRIGGLAEGDGNTVAHWGGNGIRVERDDVGSAPFVALWWLGNRIYATGQLPIELVDTVDGQGVSPGDPAPIHINAGRTAPTITAAMGDGSGTQVSYTLPMAANATYRVQAFATPACHASGYGPGQYLLGTHTFTPASGGVQTLTATGLLPAASGSAITLTATRVPTDASQQSSEFSQCFALAGGVPGTPPLVNVPGLVAGLGQFFSADLSQYVDATEGDAIMAYALVGALPAGMTFDSASRLLSGTPAVTGSTTLTFSATDKDGTADAVFTLTVTTTAGPGGSGGHAAIPTLDHAALALLSALVAGVGLLRRKRY